MPFRISVEIARRRAARQGDCRRLTTSISLIDSPAATEVEEKESMVEPLLSKAFSRQEILTCLSVLRDELIEFDEFFTRSNELDRITATASRIPVAKSEADHIVDIGGHVLWLPIYSKLLKYQKISLIQTPTHLQWSRYNGNFDETRLRREFYCDFIPANAEVTPYPIMSGAVSCVVCFEVLEHLQADPMHLISESNRILKDGGVLYITTPNVLYDRNLVEFLFGNHPFGWSVYTSLGGDRHNREYTTFELIKLLEVGGFNVETFETLTYQRRREINKRMLARLLCLLPAAAGRVPLRMRGAFSHTRARRVGPVTERYPAFLYEFFS
jgi:SAM-dependent methyltransferase